MEGFINCFLYLICFIYHRLSLSIRGFIYIYYISIKKRENESVGTKKSSREVYRAALLGVSDIGVVD